MSPLRASGSLIWAAWVRHSSARFGNRRIFSLSLSAPVLMGVNYGRGAGHVHKLDRATGARAKGEAETGAGAPNHGAALAQRRSAALAVQAAHCSAGKVWLISPPLPPRRSARSMDPISETRHLRIVRIWLLAV